MLYECSAGHWAWRLLLPQPVARILWLKLIILYDTKTHHGKPQKGAFGEAIMPILEPKSAYFDGEKGRFCNALVIKPLYDLAHSPHFLYYGAHSFYFLSAG